MIAGWTIWLIIQKIQTKIEFIRKVTTSFVYTKHQARHEAP